ncbi:PGPGW domain-containing protein [Cellulomonas marina]|uniref:TIGR02611 family protein n=1 Tax=Cellulomonas marina TaxID=988821 RepID=A0A1I1AJ65_9CELL|nr:PGPGW domain-containing protein [Cellulomonas marina]GIG29680.1 hypothetical protein Cma02nite_22800 [Cellulomonas marina]SFB36383.1 TIGR02611 family protein [Cellulomonas marina]
MTRTLEEEMDAGARSTGSAPQRLLARVRAWTDGRPGRRLAYRVLVAVVGGATVVAGIAMLVLPGPGWLAIFLGLSILASEFPVLRPVLDRLRGLVLRALAVARTWWARRRAGRS